VPAWALYAAGKPDGSMQREVYLAIWRFLETVLFEKRNVKADFDHIPISG